MKAFGMLWVQKALWLTFPNCKPAEMLGRVGNAPARLTVEAFTEDESYLCHKVGVHLHNCR